MDTASLRDLFTKPWAWPRPRLPWLPHPHLQPRSRLPRLSRLRAPTCDNRFR